MLIDYFKETLPKKPYCADDYSEGLKIRSKDKAVLLKHIQPNHPSMKSWIVIDVDKDTAGMDCLDKGPTPNLVVRNWKNGHAHYFYGLETPICTSLNARQAPIRYLEAIKRGLNSCYGGDIGYNGLIAKNPLLDKEWDVQMLVESLYSLDELSEYVDLNENKQNAVDLSDSVGRNHELFKKLSNWSYKKVKAAREKGDFNSWLCDISAKAYEFNSFSQPLPVSEVMSIARSVAKWTWTRYTGNHDSKNRGVLDFGDNRYTNPEMPRLSDEERAKRQKAGVRYTNAVRKAATEAKIKKAIAKLRLDGKPLTVASVARESGVHRNTVSTKYKHLFV